MRVTGKVKNVVDFGAFVDIGIKESALVHISQVSERFVKDPSEVLKVGDVREFRIISLDPERRRIGLSLKPERPSNAAAPERGTRAAGPHRDQDGTVDRGGSRTGGPRGDRGGPRTGSPRGDRPSRPEPVQRDDTVYNPFADLLKNRKNREK
jgi:uncharacterized protein